MFNLNKTLIVVKGTYFILYLKKPKKWAAVRRQIQKLSKNCKTKMNNWRSQET
jgi:predicted peptidase